MMSCAPLGDGHLDLVGEWYFVLGANLHVGLDCNASPWHGSECRKMVAFNIGIESRGPH